MEICFSYSRGGYFPLSCFNSAMSASTILHNHPADLVVASATSLRRIFGVAPVSLGAPVTQIKILLQACLDAGRGASNLRVTKVSPRRGDSWLNSMPLD